MTLGNTKPDLSEPKRAVESVGGHCSEQSNRITSDNGSETNVKQNVGSRCGEISAFETVEKTACSCDNRTNISESVEKNSSSGSSKTRLEQLAAVMLILLTL